MPSSSAPPNCAREKTGKNRAAGEKAVRATIAALPSHDREVAEGIDRILTEVAPHLVPKTWYRFPSYADEGRTPMRTEDRGVLRTGLEVHHRLRDPRLRGVSEARRR